MDGQRFDSLIKMLGAHTSRRAALRALAGAMAGGVLATVGVRPAAAACVNFGRSCAANDHCCSGSCIDGKCACADGKTRCGSRCVDLRYDEAHCSACNTPCAAGLTCREGVCSCSNYGATCATGDTCCSKNCVDGTCACQVGRTRCGSRCVNTATDESNCGACGYACPEGATCTKGTCVCPNACESPRVHDTDCNCVCPPTNCPTGQVLNRDTCVCEGCPGREVTCNGVCVNLSTDAAHCGDCERVCRDQEQCCAGQCVSLDWSCCDQGGYEPACPPGSHCCPPDAFLGCCPEGTTCYLDFCLSPDQEGCGESWCHTGEQCCIYESSSVDCCVGGEVCTFERGCVPEGSYCIKPDGAAYFCDNGTVCCTLADGTPVAGCCNPGTVLCDETGQFICSADQVCCTDGTGQANSMCCPGGTSCCGGDPDYATCCRSDEICATFDRGSPNGPAGGCCPVGTAACFVDDGTGNWPIHACCGLDDTCCADVGQNRCCPPGQTCCESGCCSSEGA